MRLGLKSSTGKLGAAAVRGLMLIALSAASPIPPAQARSDEEQPKKATPNKPVSAPAPKSSKAPVWVVNCSNSGAGLDCRATQSIFHEKTRQFVLSFAVRVPPDTKKPVILIRVRLGLYVPAGVLIQFGKDPVRAVPLQSCDRTGCYAEYDIADGEIAAMMKGKDVTISAQTPKREEAFNLRLSTKGFEAAYAKIK